ncbi:ATP-binding protein [Dactylosporangium sp. CA-139114]|uniref:ATP-binding protein n=1 Tax=Dactylosporangium sp. CA-139114 TaxID=3239931 RepID=UPI003D995BE9
MAEAVQTTALLVEDFDVALITPVRHAVNRGAAAAGLTGQRLEDFVLAVNEIVTNAVRHAGGGGTLRMWVADGVLVCEVVDKGAGIPEERLSGEAALPPSSAISGRGLWLARHLVDDVLVTTGEAGTIVRLSSAVSD